MSTKTIKVLIIEPGKEPYAVEIPSCLESLQNYVGGFRRALYPFTDEKYSLSETKAVFFYLSDSEDCNIPVVHTESYVPM